MEVVFKGLKIAILLLGGVAFLYVSCVMVCGAWREKRDRAKTNRFNRKIEAAEKSHLQKNADAGWDDLEQRRSRRKS